jgi:hypothetical protein
MMLSTVLQTVNYCEGGAFEAQRQVTVPHWLHFFGCLSQFAAAMSGSVVDVLLGNSIVLSDGGLETGLVYGDPPVPLPEFASFPIVHTDPDYLKQVRKALHCDVASPWIHIFRLACTLKINPEPLFALLSLQYYQRFVDVAKVIGVNVLLDTATWRASPDWGKKLG